MNPPPACVSALVDPHMVDTGTQILVILLFSEKHGDNIAVFL